MGEASIVVYLQHYILLKINILMKLHFKLSFVPAWQFISAQYKNCQSLNAEEGHS